MFLPEDRETAVLNEDGNWIIRFPRKPQDRWLTGITVEGGPGDSTIYIQIEGKRKLAFVTTGPENGFSAYPGEILIPAGLLVFVVWNRGTGPAPTGNIESELTTSRGWQDLNTP